jgi:hypothetical protein
VTEEPRRRRLDRSRLLVAAGVVVLLAAGATAAMLLRGGETKETQPGATAVPEPDTTEPAPVETETLPEPETETETAAEPPAATAPPPAPTGPAPVDTTVAATPVSATLTWRTGVPTTGHVSVGSPTLGPGRWLPATQLGTAHEVAIGALVPRRAYRVWISSRAEDGSQAETFLDVTTPTVTGPITASTDGGILRLDGQPWFPLMAYGLCSHHIDTALGADITLVALNPCGGLEEQLHVLDGRALSAGSEHDEPVDGVGLIGWFLPDEADARGMTGDALPPVPRAPAFLTLTNHFYSGADPLPQGRGIYPGLIARADVVGFDLYPLQEWCQPDRLLDVEAAQRELVKLAAGKPTYQWIEASEIKCRESPGQAVTPDTVRAESWLAIVGGAVGLGFFPAAWTAEVEHAIKRVADETAILAPSLLGRRLPARVSGAPSVRAAAWTDGRAIVVAAVNAGRTATQATISLGALGDARLGVMGESRVVTAAGGAFPDSFAPLAAHVYLLGPAT